MKTYTSMMELFSKRRRWLKGSYRDGHGAYCLAGGMNRVAKGNGLRERDMRDRIRAAIQALFPRRISPGSGGIAAFNDHSDTTFADIQRVVRKARV